MKNIDTNDTDMQQIQCTNKNDAISSAYKSNNKNRSS